MRQAKQPREDQSKHNEGKEGQWEEKKKKNRAMAANPGSTFFPQKKCLPK